MQQYLKLLDVPVGRHIPDVLLQVGRVLKELGWARRRGVDREQRDGRGRAEGAEAEIQGVAGWGKGKSERA